MVWTSSGLWLGMMCLPMIDAPQQRVRLLAPTLHGWLTASTDRPPEAAPRRLDPIQPAPRLALRSGLDPRPSAQVRDLGCLRDRPPAG